jgi:hypothetical protein
MGSNLPQKRVIARTIKRRTAIRIMDEMGQPGEGTRLGLTGPQ